MNILKLYKGFIHQNNALSVKILRKSEEWEANYYVQEDGFEYRCPLDMIEIDSLVPISRMLDVKKNISRRKLLRLYYRDLSQILQVKDLSIGNIGIIKDYEKEEFLHPNRIDIALKIESYLNNRLLLRFDDHFLDLDNYIKYDYNNIGLGQLIVSNIEPIVMAFGEIQGSEIPKKKILEMYYDKYKIEKR